MLLEASLPWTPRNQSCLWSSGDPRLPVSPRTAGKKGSSFGVCEWSLSHREGQLRGRTGQGPHGGAGSCCWGVGVPQE